MKIQDMPVYFKINGQEGYKTAEEVKIHLRRKREEKKGKSA